MKNSMYLEFSDEQLINELLKGDNNCFGIIYSRYYSKVYAKCYSFSGNREDAFDMTQEILLKAICNVSSFENNSKFSTWLYAIATNYCITQSGKKGKYHMEEIKGVHQIIEVWTDLEAYEERVKWEALELNIDKFLNYLSAEERQLLILKYRMNYSVKDLQQEFGLSSSAVKMRLHRARMRMSEIISTVEAA